MINHEHVSPHLKTLQSYSHYQRPQSLLYRMHSGIFRILDQANKTWIWIAQIWELQKSFQMILNSNQFPGNWASKIYFELLRGRLGRWASPGKLSIWNKRYARKFHAVWYPFFEQFFGRNFFRRPAAPIRFASKDVEFYCASFDIYEKFAGECPPTQTPTQKLKSEFLKFSLQEISSSLVPLEMIF